MNEYDILIVGNGLDLLCGYNTSYSNFLRQNFRQELFNLKINYESEPLFKSQSYNELMNGIDNRNREKIEFKTLLKLITGEIDVESIFSENSNEEQLANKTYIKLKKLYEFLNEDQKKLFTEINESDFVNNKYITYFYQNHLNETTWTDLESIIASIPKKELAEIYKIIQQNEISDEFNNLKNLLCNFIEQCYASFDNVTNETKKISLSDSITASTILNFNYGINYLMDNKYNIVSENIVPIHGMYENNNIVSDTIM